MVKKHLGQTTGCSELTESGIIEIFRGLEQRTSDLLLPNGDDAAVARLSTSEIAISVDAFQEGVHFSFDFSSPSDVGYKIVEATCSDVVAVGAMPRYLVFSCAWPQATAPSVIEGLRRGMGEALDRNAATLIGGDTTRSEGGVSLSVTVLGTLLQTDKWLTRSNAEPGQGIYVTGTLGASAVGLELLTKNVQGWERLKSAYQRPACRSDIISQILPHASAAIDISDGLASELHHLRRSSNTNFMLQADLIPLHTDILAVRDELDYEPLHYALCGGEDFELLFTSFDDTSARSIATRVGDVSEGDGVWLEEGSGIEALADKGYTHFKR